MYSRYIHNKTHKYSYMYISIQHTLKYKQLYCNLQLLWMTNSKFYIPPITHLFRSNLLNKDASDIIDCKQ